MKILKVKDVKTPSRGTELSAGFDFYVPNDVPWDSKVLKPGESINIPSGIKAIVPKDYALIAFNKSGVALNQSLDVGACVHPETYIKTNKGLFQAIDLTKEFIEDNDISILSYNIDDNIYEYKKFDGFRVSNITDCYKVTFEDDSEIIISSDHKVLEENNQYININENNFKNISIRQAPTDI